LVLIISLPVNHAIQQIHCDIAIWKYSERPLFQYHKNMRRKSTYATLLSSQSAALAAKAHEYPSRNLSPYCEDLKHCSTKISRRDGTKYSRDILITQAYPRYAHKILARSEIQEADTELHEGCSAISASEVPCRGWRNPEDKICHDATRAQSSNELVAADRSRIRSHQADASMCSLRSRPPFSAPHPPPLLLRTSPLTFPIP